MINNIIGIILTLFGIYSIITNNFDNVICFVFIGCFGIVTQSFMSYLLELDKNR